MKIMQLNTDMLEWEMDEELLAGRLARVERLTLNSNTSKIVHLFSLLLPCGLCFLSACSVMLLLLAICPTFPS